MLMLGGIFVLALRLERVRHGNSKAIQKTDIPSVTGNLEPAPADSEADALFRGEVRSQQQLAANVIEDINQGISATSFQTGNPRFDGEWAVGSYQMAVLGLGQILLAHPELREEYAPIIEQCLERLLTSDMSHFGTDAWGEEGLSSLESANGHVYLGYTNLALSMLRLHKENNQFAQINDQLTAALVRRLAAAPNGIIETYPGEAYPADLAAVMASIALYDRATGKSHEKLLKKLILQFRQIFVDPATGLVFQAVDANSGAPMDQPRASGSALSVYFLSFVDPESAKAIFQSVTAKQTIAISGFTGIREYPSSQEGSGDIDSGPLILGASPSATAFALSGARLFDQPKLYRKLYQTIQGFGKSPMGQVDGVSLLESPLGNAILLAMLTAGEASQ